MTKTSAPSPLRRRAALAIVGLTVSTLGATVIDADVASAAGKAKVNSSISLARGASDLVGKVKSRKKVCKKKVQVVLYFRQPGTKKFVTVAEDKTSRKGAWKIDAPGSKIPAGKYYVKTPAAKVCKPGKSKTITVR